MQQQILTAKTPQAYEQMRDFRSEFFLHPDDFFLDNFKGGDYEMLLALPENNLVLATK